MNNEEKEFKKYIVRQELTVLVLKLVNGFESKEEPNVKLSENDKLHVLANIVSRQLLK